MGLLDVARGARRRDADGSSDEALMSKTVANILNLSLVDRDRYRSDVEAALGDDPWAEHDREALRRADGVLAQGKDDAA